MTTIRIELAKACHSFDFAKSIQLYSCAVLRMTGKGRERRLDKTLAYGWGDSPTAAVEDAVTWVRAQRRVRSQRRVLKAVV